MATIGQNIKLCRERQNLSLEELARKLRVGIKTVEKFESDLQKPDTQTILNISTVLDIPASELLQQEYQSHFSAVDRDVERLVNEIGTEKAKFILTKAKEIDEEDFFAVMNILEKMDNKHNIKFFI